MTFALSYKSVSLAASLTCSGLFLLLLLAPGIVYWLFGLEAHISADVISRRAAMLFLGFAALTFLSRNELKSSLRDMVMLCIALTMIGLMAMGIFEFLRGTAEWGIWAAICVEGLFATLYLSLLSQQHDRSLS